MAEEHEVTIDLNLDGKLLQMQFRSAKKLKNEVIDEFLAEAKAQGVTLTLAKGMRREAVLLKSGDEPAKKWLLSLYIEAKEIGTGDGKHFDFEDSAALYAWLKNEGKKSESKAKLRLVYDACSDSRADVLYPIVKDIEREFRVLALKLGIDLGDSVQNRKTGEHLICNMETSELFGVLFMRPASSKYYLKKLAAAETDEQREQARNLTIVDEVGFSEFKDFLVKMHNVRNPVMHGRYISEAKFQSALTMLKKIRKKLDQGKLYDALVVNEEFMRSLNEMMKTIAGTAETMKAAAEMATAMQKSIAPIIEPTLKMVNSMVANMMPVKELTSQITAFSKTMYDVTGIAKDASRMASMMPKATVPTTTLNFLAQNAREYTSTMKIVIKRVYDEPSEADGYRVLVDRLWPRGVKKETLALDEWCKDIAPSTELRKWFAHDPAKFEEFAARYISELEASEVPKALLARAKGSATLTLVYAAKDPKVSHATVLQDYLANLQ